MRSTAHLCTEWSFQTGTRCGTLPWRSCCKGGLHRIENNLLVAAGKGEDMGGATRGYVALCWLLLTFLYRQKIFLKV
ncbi:MAG: hypothetical protein K5651_03245 [Bacteroidales bacterium]|nr:hypothetical protein [Bacteroidales bacterium]